VNFAWNSRHVERVRVISCDNRDFKAWDRFPRQFKRLWPSPSRYRGKPRRVGPDGRLSFGPILLNIKAAIAAISSMCKAIEANADMTEYELVHHMTRLYECMNRIWNQRGLKTPPESLSAAQIRRHSLFPRAFRGRGMTYV